MENSKQAEKRKQEDAALTRALLWFVAAVVLEFLLLFVNKHYINFTTAAESIHLAQILYRVLQVSAVAGIAGCAGCVVWGRKQWMEKKVLSFPAILVGSFLLAAGISAALILRFHAAAIELLCVAVPAGAVLALAYYLYQKEFFLSMCGVGLGMLGLWLVRKAAGGHLVLVWGYTIVAGAVLVLAALAVLRLKKDAGVFTWKDKKFPILSKRANFSLILLSLAIALAAMLAAAVLGSTVAYYLLIVLLAWLFVLLVYYTVKLM